MLSLLALLACGPGRDSITVYTTEARALAARSFVERLPWEGAEVVVTDDPAGAARGKGLAVAWVEDLDCGECYELRRVGKVVEVHAGDVLGLQYGLADVLEQAGFRFHHPVHTYAPERLGALDETRFEVRHEPEIGRRGLQMHTLHPIEGLYDFWVPGEGNLDRAKGVIDWVVKNRGDHIQWVALDDIVRNPAKYEPWKAHTAAIIAEAHARGLSVSTGVQLFASGNLQLAFDLLEGQVPPADQPAAVKERMGLLLTEETPFDMINLSFGEFFAEGPEAFLASTNSAKDAMHELSPELEVTGLIHVGADLVVEYQGQEMIYYLLVGFADEDITPWIHTVMYYNLFDDPGGSYHHEEYDQHRTFLLERLEAGRPVAYFPESAYWIAFDNSVPTYLPIYVRSRWEDVRGVRAATGSPMTEHVLFSSGWEWGYWQHDTAFFRMSWKEPADWHELLAFEYAPYDPSGELAGIVNTLGDKQYELLLQARLAPWFASRDSIMEFGYTRDIVSQPVRLGFDEVHALPAPELAAFEAETLAGLGELEAAHAEARASFDALGLDLEHRFIAEIGDGLAVDADRARFIRALTTAVVAHAKGEDPGPSLAEADAALADGRAVVQRRHANLHDPEPSRLLLPTDNPTLYQYGYLRWADELCFWERERAQVLNLVQSAGLTVPGCAL